MKPYNYALLALGIGALVSIPAFNIEAPAAWLCAITGIILCIFAGMVKTKTLKHLGNGLYENTHPPLGDTYLKHQIREPKDNTEEAIDYLISIFVSQKAWVGVSVHRICADFKDDTNLKIIEALKELSRLGLIEKILVLNADDPQSGKTTVFLVSPEFENLVIY